ncbi:hypothetical protein IJ096_02360, partial [Candidatus Saccharibacteria bacterium]|nr:hypothetical protein [Candidatus Saccharibacteria bacterium]
MITTPVKTPPNTSTKPPKSSKKSQKSPKSSNSPLSKLKKILEILLIILPSALFFSYHPVISLGDTASMHIELSLPLLLLALISFLSLPLLPHTIKSTPKKLLLAFLIIPCYTI